MDEEDEWGEFNLQPAESQPPPPVYNESEYQQSTEPDYFRQPTEEDASIPRAAQPTAGADPWAEFNLQPAQQAAAPAANDPWAEFNLKPPEAEGTWTSLARSAINALPSTLAGLSGGAIAAGIGSTIGRVVGGVGGSAVAPGVGTVAGWLGGGLAGGALGEYVYSEGKKMLGWDDSIQAAVNAKAHPIATAAGEVAPLVAGLSPGRGAQVGARLLSGAIGGGIEAGSQAVQGDLSLERLGANVAAGVLLPGNRGWLTRVEGAGKEAAGMMGLRPPVETAGRKASEWTGPPADIPEAPPPAQGEFPGLKPFTEDVAGGRQMEMPLEPPVRPPEPTGQGKLPLGPEPVIDENGQYRFSTSGAEEGAPRYDHGTPGPEAAAGVSEAQTPPPKAPGHGPEDWGKKTAPTEGAAGVNVGKDPTLDFAINPDQPIKAQQAGPMKDLDARIKSISDGPMEEAPAKLREMADEYRRMGQEGNAREVDKTLKVVEDIRAAHAPREAAVEAKQDVLRGPEPGIDARMREQGVPPRRPGEPLQTATPEEINARMREQGVPPRQEPAADTRVPSWVTENNAAAVDFAKRAGLTEEIGRRAQAGETAKQISEALGGKLDTNGVRAVRDSLGIEPAGPLQTPGGASIAVGERVAGKQMPPKAAEAVAKSKAAAAEKRKAAQQAKAAVLEANKLAMKEGFEAKAAQRAEAADKRPANVAGDFHVEKNPAGPGHVIMRGDEVLPGSYPTKGPAFIAMNKMAKEAGGPTQQQQQQQTPQPSRPSVRTSDGAVFTGDTVGQAAEFARKAGYREHQIIRPKEAAAPPAEPPAGGGEPPKAPPPGAAPPAGTPPPSAPPGSVEAAREHIDSRISNKKETLLDRIPKTIGEAKDLWNEFYRNAKNEFDPLERLTNRDPNLKADENFNVLARLTNGLRGRVAQMLDHKTYDINTRQVNGDALRTVLEPVREDIAGFTRYAVAKRSIELQGRGVDTGIDAAMARQVVAADAAKYEKTFKDLGAYQDRLLDNLHRSGVLSAESLVKMRQLNKEYVPFYRLMDPKSDLAEQIGGGLQTRDPIHGIKGSEKEVLNPIDSIVKNTYLFTAIAERNKTMQAFEKWALKNPGVIERDRSTHPVPVKTPELQRWMDKHGIADFAEEALTVFRPDAFRASADSIRVFNNGKANVYKVMDPAVGKAINALDKDQVNTMTKLLSYPASLLRAGAVLSPEFIARNPIRDQFSAFVNSKHGYIPVYDMLRGAAELWGKGEKFQDWMIHGGANATLVGMDRKTIGMDAKTLTDKTWAVIKSPIDALRVASEFMENSTRIGEFMRAVEKGKSSTEAAYASREVSLDFARMGAKARTMNAIIPFFNAQVEGVDRTARAFRDNPMGTLTKVGLSITAPSVALWYANKDDARYQELPQWQKDLFWIVPTDHWTNMSAQDAAKIGDAHKRQIGDQWQRNDGTIYRIPKPFELGVLFGSLPERMLQAMYKDDPKAFSKFGDTMTKAFLPNFIPQAATPLIEQFGNRSLFTDRALVPKYMENLPPAKQFTDRTSEVAKLAGQAMSYINPKSSFGSPIVIDNYIRGYSGGVGGYVVNAMDKVLETSGALGDKAARPSWTAADTPLLKAFAARFPDAGAESIQRFYDVWGDRQAAKAEIAQAKRTGDPEAARQIQRDTAALAAADATHKQLGEMHKKIAETTRDTQMTPEDKRDRIDVLYLQMIEQSRKGVERFERRKAARATGQ